MTFALHPNLATKSFIIDLPLCRVLLEDRKAYPWLILVPRRPNLRNLLDLDLTDELTLAQELRLSQTILQHQFHPDQLNVAALGNKTPQLHIHVIARFSHDPAWPKAVWDHPSQMPYPLEEKKRVVNDLKMQFAASCCQSCEFKSPS